MAPKIPGPQRRVPPEGARDTVRAGCAAHRDWREGAGHTGDRRPALESLHGPCQDSSPQEEKRVASYFLLILEGFSFFP